MDESGLELAARGLSFLIQVKLLSWTSLKSPFIEKILSSEIKTHWLPSKIFTNVQKWSEFTVVESLCSWIGGEMSRWSIWMGSFREVCEWYWNGIWMMYILSTRLASSILLRELALFTSTSFFLRVDSYFSSIFHMMRSPKVLCPLGHLVLLWSHIVLEVRVRLAAASSLHATLSLTSQREAKDKRKWYYTCYEEAFGTHIHNGEILTKDERFHCMLLTLNELLRIADGSIERYSVNESA